MKCKISNVIYDQVFLYSLCNYVHFDIMQANSPMRTLDELHVCEMPAWPCFPSPEERNRSPRSAAEAQDSDKPASKSTDPSLSSQQDTPEKLRCLVVTARARSFLYHQVRNHAPAWIPSKLLSLELSSWRTKQPMWASCFMYQFYLLFDQHMHMFGSDPGAIKFCSGLSWYYWSK